MGPRACTINSCHNHKLYLAGRSVLQIVAATHITLAITINQLATVERPSVRFCTSMDLPLPQKSWFLISTCLFFILKLFTSVMVSRTMFYRKKLTIKMWFLSFVFSFSRSVSISGFCGDCWLIFISSLFPNLLFVRALLLFYLIIN